MKIEEKLTLILIWLNLNNLAENQTSIPAKQYKIFTDVNINESEWEKVLIKQFNAVNKLQCLANCQKNQDCNLVNFNKKNNYCKLYSDYLIDEEINLIDSKENMIYMPTVYDLKGIINKQSNLIIGYIRSMIQLSNRNIACGLENGTIIILSHVDLNFVREMNSHSSAVYSMHNLKNGYLVSGSNDFKIKIWDHLTGVLINTLIGHTNNVIVVKVLSNNDIASGSGDKTVRIWDSSTGLIKLNYTQHIQIIYDLSELSNNRIVSLDVNGNIRIWNYLNGDLISSKKIDFRAASMFVCKNGDYAIGAYDNGSLVIYDSTTFNLKHNLIGHTERVIKIIQLENEDLCSGSFDNTIKCWDWNTKTVKFNLNHHNSDVTSIIQLHNGYLASSGFVSKVIIWK